ncbi:hypothetical protein NESM_000495100 [Novymonas esmeraldas]|uniref:Uncharacterized protein n=1 Tax=Novymonas esmeraldas TaxID=1808958 RepID=A0AAW0ENE9_9TRYP
MTAVQSVLRLFELDTAEGTITALDSYGSDTHVGTSRGQLIRLHAAAAAAAADDGAVTTTVVRRSTISPSGASVQQLQHSRSQRLLFALCGGRLLLLQADTYVLLTTIAVEAVSFSVAAPLPVSGAGGSARCSGEASVLTTPHGASQPHTRVHTGRLATGEEDEEDEEYGGYYRDGGRHAVCAAQGAGAPVTSPLGSSLGNSAAGVHSHHSRQSHRSLSSHGRESRADAAGHASSPSILTNAAAAPWRGRAHVVCVAERHKKELSVYVVDRVRGSSSSAAAAGANAPLAVDDTLANSSAVSTASSSPRCAPPPRVVLRQRYVLPEPAQHVLMCHPAPGLRRGPSLTLSTAASTRGGGGGGLPFDSGVEAGLCVCVGMRREVSLLSLLGGSPWCVLRLDGSRPPLLSVGSDSNTFLVRTQAPNTVMEVGVPPAAATAGCVPASDGEWRAGSVHPIALRSVAAAEASRRGRDDNDEIVMGEVLQSDAPVELVLARFPHVFLFTAHHCDVVSLLDVADSSTAAAASGAAASSAPASASGRQRVPLPGIRYGALRGQGTLLFVASERAVWGLQLTPLRAQLAELVSGGNTDAAFQTLAYHRRRAAATSAAGADAEDALCTIESDVHCMAGFAALHRGDVDAALRHLRHRIDPREVLLSLPDCIPLPPPAVAVTVAVAAAAAAATSQAGGGEYTLHRAVTVPSLDAYDALLQRHTAADAPPATVFAGPPSPAFWADWHGPCVYNSYAGAIAQAWRAAAAAASASSAADDFVARCLDRLRSAVRDWFAEEMFSTASAGNSTDAVRDCGRAATPPPAPSLPPPRPAAHRRAMAYALLVLAWEAQDACMVHRIVASSSSDLHLDDCVDVLLHRREHRLLAALQFRSGHAAACLATLRSAVAVSVVLARRHGCVVTGAASASVVAQLRLWQQCMMAQSVGEGCGGDRGGGLAPATAPVLGRALLLSPSVAVAASVARTLFGVVCGHGDSVSTAADVVDGIAAYYTAVMQHAAAAAAGGAVAETGTGAAAQTGADLLELRLSLADHSDAAACISFPHTGLLLCTAVADTLTGDRRPRRVHVVPSALTELFYLVEMLDVAGVKQLLRLEPRSAQLRDEEGSTALHIAMAQLGPVCLARTHDGLTSAASSSSPSASSAAALTAWHASRLQLLCALCAMLVHFGCPAGALNHYGWSCLDVAAVACAGNTTAFDIVTAALLAAAEVREAL